MRVLIADDEAPARERLRLMLAAYPNVEIVGEAVSGTETMRKTVELKPNVLLLDIQMPDGTGLDVTACLPSPRPAIIFCTAFDQHAIEAFELNALDYLLKPVSRVRLAQAMAKLGGGSPTERSLDNLGRQSESRLLVRNGSHYIVVPSDKVAYFEATDGLTRMMTDEGQEHWLDPSLQELEARVVAGKFFRVSRSALVKLGAVTAVHPFPGGAGELILKGGTKLEVSRRRLKDLLAALRGD